MIIVLIFAFMAGFITILSPCILSIAPILLAAGAEQSRYKPFGIIIGLIISFSFFTLALTAIVQATNVSPDIFRYVALGIIIFFGLTMVIPAFENAFNLLTARIAHIGSAIEIQSTHIKTEFVSGLLLGIALGLLWTPCAGPILATISTIAATGGITLTTIFMTLAYSCGAAIPMLLIAFGGAKIISSTTSLAPYTHTIRQLFGIIIIVSAIAIILHVDTIIQEHIAHFFPNISLENSPLLHKELNTLLRTSDAKATKDIQGFEDQVALNQKHTGHIAPELVGISEWLNSQPLTLAQLRGKVVFLDFWTYTCINCIRTLPHITEWYKAYKDKGLEIIGIHTPEFAFEKSKSHVEEAIKRFNITYPVALDNNYKTWQAYNNRYWPAHYLIDQNGMIVKMHFGEGDYVDMENAIRALLNMTPCGKVEECAFSKALTPETYLGFERGDRYDESLHLQHDQAAPYHSTQPLGDDKVGLSGSWIVANDHIHSETNNNEISLNFIANHVYLVMQSDKPQYVTVLLNNKPVPQKYWSRDMTKDGKILVHEPRAYEVIDLKQDYGRHILTLQCPKNINAYVFTFGGEHK